jgi:hypothetical protein
MIGYSSVDTYQRFEGTCCFHLQDTSHFYAAAHFSTLKTEEIPPKRQYLTDNMASYQKTVTAQRSTPLDGARENKAGKVHIKVTLGRVRETTAAVEEQQVLHIASVCL